MPLPVTFASLATATLSQLDANFNALGALTPIPCAVAGINSLVLTPEANTPTVAAYANYMQFTGIVAATNTGAMTAAVGGLTALNVYIDTASGPTLVGAGEVVQNTSFTLMYDSTLNSGAGGFHLSSAAVSGSFLALSGGTLTGPLIGTSIGISGALTAASASVTGVLSGSSIVASGNIAAGSVTATVFNGAAASLSGALVAAKLVIPPTGQSVTRILATTATLAFGSIAAQSTGDQTVTLAGCQIDDSPIIGYPAAPVAGLIAMPFVSATNIVTIRFGNLTTIGTLTPPSGVYTAAVLGFS